MTLHDADMRKVFKRLADDWSGDRPVHADHSPHGHTSQSCYDKSEQRPYSPDDSAPDGGTEAASHIEFVLEHDGLIPEEGFGGCSCETCEAIRQYVKAKLLNVKGDSTAPSGLEGSCMSNAESNCMLKSNEGEPNEEFPYDDIAVGGNCIP